MKNAIAVVMLSLAGATFNTIAADNPQHEQMRVCNAEARERKLDGDARKSFIKECLSARPLTQQEKMTACNKEAGAQNLKGEDRKAYIAKCLAG